MVTKEERGKTAHGGTHAPSRIARGKGTTAAGDTGAYQRALGSEDACEDGPQKIAGEVKGGGMIEHPKGYRPLTLKQIHAAEALKAEGWRWYEIARQMGVDRFRLSTLMRAHRFNEKLREKESKGAE